jgi:hypothetical protein
LRGLRRRSTNEKNKKSSIDNERRKQKKKETTDTHLKGPRIATNQRAVVVLGGL